MRPTDTTPIQDPRNAVGLMIAVIDLVLTGDDPEPWRTAFATARDLGHEFSKASRRVFNGYARRDGIDLYTRATVAHDELRSRLNEAGSRRSATSDRILTLANLFDHALAIARLAVRNLDDWKAYTHERVLRDHYNGNVRSTTPALWPNTWHNFVSTALRLGADGIRIELLECNWRFRDLTNRKHRGLHRRAAFEAAWLVGNYTFAKQLLS